MIRALHRGHAPQRIIDALRLGMPLTTTELQLVLSLKSSTAQAALRSLHSKHLVRPVGHTAHVPGSRRRAGAIRWLTVAETHGISRAIFAVAPSPTKVVEQTHEI